MVGGGIDTDTQCIIVKNIEGNLKLSLQETQLPTLSGASTGLWNSQQTRNDQLTTLELRRGFILPAFEITVPGPTIRFTKILLEMGFESHNLRLDIRRWPSWQGVSLAQPGRGSQAPR